MKSKTLDGRDREFILRCVHNQTRRLSRYRKVPLWGWVSDMTSFGCTYSHRICHDLGWNPAANASDPLPRNTVSKKDDPDEIDP